MHIERLYARIIAKRLLLVGGSGTHVTEDTRVPALSLLHVAIEVLARERARKQITDEVDREGVMMKPESVAAECVSGRGRLANCACLCVCVFFRHKRQQRTHRPRRKMFWCNFVTTFGPDLPCAEKKKNLFTKRVHTRIRIQS